MNFGLTAFARVCFCSNKPSLCILRGFRPREVSDDHAPSRDEIVSVIRGVPMVQAPPAFSLSPFFLPYRCSIATR